MEFASPYFLVTAESDQEQELFNDDALLSSKKENNDYLSDEEDFSVQTTEKSSRQRKVRKADPNVCAVNLGSLGDTIPVFTGDPIICNSCSVYFTDSSHLTDDKQDTSRWICEYCGHENPLSVEDEEIPKGSSVDYLLAPPSPQDNLQDDLVVFCIDISGSMCCTSEVKGDFKIRQDPTIQESLSQFIEHVPGGGGLADQWMPNQPRDVSYVSRLQCVQAAISDQIEKLAQSFPSKRVVVVTFSNDVTIHLFGEKKHVITGDHLFDFDYLLKFRETSKLDLSAPVKLSEKEMVSTVLSLTENGGTALGPALLTAIGLCSEKRGSSVVLCTDGVANIGLGSLEDLHDGNVDTHPAPGFYLSLAQHALNTGTTVSICSIKGANARLEYIAKVSAETRGMNDVVDPLDLSKNFNFILENAIVATNVSCTMFLHKGLKFRHEKGAKGKTSVTRFIGNCLKESVITFEYQVKDINEIKGLTRIPFQLQVSYTKLDGTNCIRIISKEELVTNDRAISEQNVKVEVVGIHSAQQAAHYAQKGNYGKARMKQKANMRMVKRSMQLNPTANEAQKSQIEAYTKQAVKINYAIKKTKMKEVQRGNDDYDSAEDDASSEEDSDSPKPTAFGQAPVSPELSEIRPSTQTMKQKRKVERGSDDDLSNVLYGAQNPLFSDYSGTS